MIEHPFIKDKIMHTDDSLYEDIISTNKEIGELAYECKNKADVYILRNYTIENIEQYIKYYGYKYDIDIHTDFSDYDSYLYEILETTSRLHSNKYELVYLTLCLDNLPFAFDKNGLLDPNKVISHVTKVLDKIKESITTTIAVSTFVPPVKSVGFVKDTACFDYCIGEINQAIRKYALMDNHLLLIDYEKILLKIGYDRTFDARYWFMFKSPLTNAVQNVVAEEIVKLVANIEGIFKKVIVLDCDNTLWGGIIGEDGLRGIKLSQNDYPGNIYYCFQQQLISLSNAGVLLAICSKNNETDVMEVLKNHPGCPLKVKHLAAWKINWESKVSNIIELSKELNLGLDSFIFIDDDNNECNMVASSLPMVEVIQVPKKTYKLPDILRNYTLFNKLYSTQEEANLTQRYEQQRRRAEQINNFDKIEQYLASLELEADINEASNDDLARVAQLTQKTNQFNLTTKRYSIGEIEEMNHAKDYLILILKVKDKFGEYGLTGVCILKNDKEGVHIIELLLSCRILGRMLEDVFLGEVIASSKERFQNSTVLTEYIKTTKNEQVSRFYDDRQFTCFYSDGSSKKYKLNIVDFKIKNIDFIKINRRK